MSLWLGGLFCLFFGMMVLMEAGDTLSPLHIRNKWQGAALGCGITALLHSSSAVSCSVCAMVQKGSIPLSAAFTVLVGSNVGTCITPLLTALGLETPSYGLLLPLLGLLFLALKAWLPRLSSPMAGFCLLMFGMNIMSGEENVFAVLAVNPLWRSLIATPLGAWLLGLVSTALLQSSSLTMSLLQVYTLSSPLTMDIALPFILGQNIGTTVTALLATLSAAPIARKCAYYHIKFNVIGSLWALPLAILLRIPLTFTATPIALALAHTIFNLVCALLHLLLDPALNPTGSLQRRLFTLK